MKHKFLASILALSMLLGILPGTALAVEDDTAAEPIVYTETGEEPEGDPVDVPAEPDEAPVEGEDDITVTEPEQEERSAPLVSAERNGIVAPAMLAVEEGTDSIVTDETSLFTAIQNATNGDIIIVEGIIEITKSIIVQNKSITIQGKDSGSKIIFGTDVEPSVARNYWSESDYNSRNESYDSYGGSMFYVGTEDGDNTTIQIDSSAFSNELFTTTLTLKNIILDANAKSRVGYVGKRGKLVLEDGACLQNGRIENHSGGILNVGYMELNGGTVKNCEATGTGYWRGGAIYCHSGVLTMSGGLISNNKSPYVGAIMIDDNGEMTMTGGSITENEATKCTSTISCGGVLVREGATLTLSDDAQIYNNKKDVEAAYGSNDILLERLKSEAPILNIAGKLKTEQTMNICWYPVVTDSWQQLPPTKRIIGTELYTLTWSDLSKFDVDDTLIYNYALFLKSEENAIYSGSAITITFSFQNGEKTATQEVVCDIDVPLNPNPFTLTGYTFTEWSTQPGGGETTYTDKGTINVSEDTILYAQWSKIASLSLSADQDSVTYGNEITLTADPAVDGWTYQWYKVDGETETALENEASKTLTLKNVSDSGSYKVKIIPEGDSDTISSDAIPVTITKATLPTPELSGYTATATSITVTAPILPTGASEVQYSIDGGEHWQNINVFSDLTAGTTYTVTAKFVADSTGNYADSASSESLSVQTSAASSDAPGSSGGSHSSSSSSSSSTTYTVTVDSGKNGTVTSSAKNAKPGATVTLTVTAKDGYELDDLTVTDKNGKNIKVTEGKNGKFTFTMPAGKVTVEASFAKIAEDTARRFADVPDGHWAEDAIEWAAGNGYMNGNTAATFNPDGTVTRQQLWMILARLSGYQPADFAEAKAWAVDNRVSDGSNPGNPVSRQQLVTILYRYAVMMGYKTSGTADLTRFPDHASVAAYATDAMSWSVANGIVGGTTQGTLNPAGTATRAQFAVILMRFVENLTK